MERRLDGTDGVTEIIREANEGGFPLRVRSSTASGGAVLRERPGAAVPTRAESQLPGHGRYLETAVTCEAGWHALLYDDELRFLEGSR